MRSTEYDITISSDEIITAKTVVNTVIYTYDSEDKLTKKSIVPTSGTEQVIYYENSEDNTVVKFKAGGRQKGMHICI